MAKRKTPGKVQPSEFHAKLRKTLTRGRIRHSIAENILEGEAHGRPNVVPPERLRQAFVKLSEVQPSRFEELRGVRWSRAEACRRIAHVFGVSPRTVRNHTRDIPFPFPG